MVKLIFKNKYLAFALLLTLLISACQKEKPAVNKGALFYTGWQMDLLNEIVYNPTDRSGYIVGKIKSLGYQNGPPTAEVAGYYNLNENLDLQSTFSDTFAQPKGFIKSKLLFLKNNSIVWAVCYSISPSPVRYTILYQIKNNKIVGTIDSFYNYNLNELIALKDGGFMMFSGSKGFVGGNFYPLNSVTKYNSSLQKVSSFTDVFVKPPTSNIGVVGLSFCENTEGNITIMGNTLPASVNGTALYNMANSMFTLDNTGQLIKGPIFFKTNEVASQGIEVDKVAKVFSIPGGYNTVSEVYNSANGSYDIFVRKLDMDLNLIWEKNYGSNGNETLQSAFLDKDNNLVFTGINPKYADQTVFFFAKVASSNGHQYYYREFTNNSIKTGTSYLNFGQFLGCETGDSYLLCGTTYELDNGYTINTYKINPVTGEIE